MKADRRTQKTQKTQKNSQKNCKILVSFRVPRVTFTSFASGSRLVPVLP